MFSFHSHPSAWAFAALLHQPRRAGPTPASPGTCETQRRVLPASRCCVPPPACPDFHLGSGDVLIAGSSHPQPGVISTAASWTNLQGFCPCALRFPPSIPQVLPLFSFLRSKFSNPRFCKAPVAEWLGFGLCLCQVRRFCRRERGRRGAGRKGKGKRGEQQRGGSLLNHQLTDTARCCTFPSTVSSCETLILSSWLRLGWP